LQDLGERIAARTLSPTELVQRCLDRIAEVDRDVMAWVHVDADGALAEAQACEREAQAGRLRGPLHGIPLGVKDIIDVAGLPTRCGSRSRAGRGPAAADAEIVSALKAAGAIVLGKVHTTEFAFFDPAPTRNPHDIRHTPGGSSSGSAAALASGTVPLAIGTQTFASVNRPAAYCGVAAFKPSTRSFSGFGMTPLGPYTDTVGFFGWTVEDAVRFYEAVRPPSMPADLARRDRLRVVMLQDALLDEAAPKAMEACRDMLDAFGQIAVAEVRPAALPLAEIVGRLRTIMLYEMARIHGHLLGLQSDLIGERLREGLQAGLSIPAERYLSERRTVDDFRTRFFRSFPDVDVFLWPAAPGPAPDGTASTGDPRFIAPWTALGGPIVTMPAGLSAAGLPLGCILAGHPGADAAMCSSARELSRFWDGRQRL
jgi:aspartyl-tRNA(Asn)/glutamyl-tRNA(Gln) amidotransferase subunit A